MVKFLRAWFTGYWNPGRAVRLIEELPAPGWGLVAVLVRAATVSLLWYLPNHLAGRFPMPAPCLTFVPVEKYYLFLTWFTPIQFLLVWVLGGGVTYLVFRAAGRKTDLDLILNVCGIAGLVSGTAIVVFDMTIRAAGWDMSRNLWGSLHLVLDFWYYAVAILGLRRIVCVPFGLAVGAVAAQFAVALPLAMLVMRA